MNRLEMKFLGGFEILRQGEPQALPPSKKTRALIPYLALNGRSFSREHLCELLWEVPDDPRGSLRWSLSKIRKLIDTDQNKWLIADRASVKMNVEQMDIDVIALADFCLQLPGATVESLEAAVKQFDGNFLEGLNLPDFHSYHSWYISFREQALANQAQILQTLVTRLANDLPRAIPYSRKLATLCPYDEAIRADLIRMLVRSGNLDEADQQYVLGVKMLKEVQQESSGLLFSARRGTSPQQPPSRAQPDLSTHLPVAPPTQHNEPGFVGRTSEQNQLLHFYADCTDQHKAKVVLLTGVAGIGKSRLIDSFTQSLKDVNLFMGSAFESEAIRPFALWIDALKLVSRVDGNSGIFNSDELENRDRLFDRLSEFVLEQCQSDQTLVIVFDDIHWSDESSMAALHYIIRINRDRQILCVLAGRTDELRDNSSAQKSLRGLKHDGLLHQINVSQLSDGEIQTLIELQSPDADSDFLSMRCGGNPLLAIELARAVTSGDSGESIRELVSDRLMRFPPDGVELLHWAALVPSRIEARMLAELSGIEEYRANEIFATAENFSILRTVEGHYQFVHDLVAESITAEISPARLHVMHRAIAEHLEKNTVELALAAEMSHHAALSGDAALAGRAAISAGRLCLRFFANEEACQQAQKGLVWAQKLNIGTAIGIIIDLNDILLAAAPVADADTTAIHYAELAEIALDHGAHAHARLGYHMSSYVRWMTGQWAGAKEQSLQAERVTRDGSEEDHIIGMAEAAKCLAMIEQDLSEADAMLMEAQALAKRSRVSHYAIPSAHGILRYYENKLDEAESFFKEARTLCKSAGDRVEEFQTLEYQTMIALQRRDFKAAKGLCIPLLLLGNKIRMGSEAPLARALSGLCEFALSDEASKMNAALEELRIVDAKHRLAYVLNRAGFIDIEAERFDAAITKAEEALDYATKLERASEVMLANIVLMVANTRKQNLQHSIIYRQNVNDLMKKPIAGWALDCARNELESAT